jgi:3-hydroxybutyryl-CoA dehydrogenase
MATRPSARRNEMNWDVRKIALIGCGYMGTQIVFQVALHGFSVHVFDLDRQAYTKVLKAIVEESDRRLKLNLLGPEEKDIIFKKIHWCSSLEEAVKYADLVIETIREDLEAKRKLFGEIERHVSAETVLATGSSSLKASLIEDVLQHPERILNVHFYRLFRGCNMAEVMAGSKTSAETVEKVKEWLLTLDCVPLLLKKEITGFLFNRIWRAIKRESLHQWAGGYADFEDIDRAWMIFTGMTMGPFGAMDLIGLDLVHDIEMIYFHESKDPSDVPPTAFKQMIARGELGVKTGKGFYIYPNPAYLGPGWLKGKPI